MGNFYDFISSYYEICKALHIISVICWIASIIYLLRLFVYHSKVSIGSESDSIFKTMECRVIIIIMNPSMVVTYITGIINAYIYGFSALGLWFFIKLLAVFIITFFHLMSIFLSKKFFVGKNTHRTSFFRIISEIPTLMMVLAVFMVVLKPFE